MFNKPDMRSCGFSSSPHENVATNSFAIHKRSTKEISGRKIQRHRLAIIQIGEKPNKHHQNAINTKPDQLNFTSRSPNLQI